MDSSDPGKKILLQEKDADVDHMQVWGCAKCFVCYLALFSQQPLIVGVIGCLPTAG